MPKSNIVVNMLLPNTGVSGYSVASTELLNALKTHPNITVHHNPKEYSQKPDITLIINIPTVTQYLSDIPKARCTILLSMIEAQPLPQSWARWCEHVDHIFVPSNHSKRVFSEAQPKPVSVVPLIVSSLFYSPIMRERTFPIRFLLASAYLESRKNAALVYNVFRKHYFNDERVALHIQARAIDGAANIATEGNIYVEVSARKKPEILQLYHTHEVLIYPSAGEGFCYPILEAAATGMPVITTYVTAMTDYLDELAAVKIVPTDFTTPIVYPPYMEEAYAATVTEEQLVAAIEETIARYDELRRDAYTKASFVPQHYSADVVVQAFYERFTEILS